MNYVRLMELPLTLTLLEPKKDLRFLDISSPKLLPFFLSISGYRDLVIADNVNYFSRDFSLFGEFFSFKNHIELLDAQRLPYASSSFDRISSVSVLEHIPERGDSTVIHEVARILRPGGLFVCTLPAYASYIEEWQKRPTFYWPAPQRQDGRFFYQRRYDGPSIRNRLSHDHLFLEDTVYIAERPIKEPSFDENDMLLHNFYYIEKFRGIQLARKLSRQGLPLLPYLLYRSLSKQYHYLTRDEKDSNIRQVALKMRKI